MATDFGTLILNETPDAVILTSPAGEVLCWTPGAQAVFGYSAEEALGHLLHELIVPADRVSEETAVMRQTLDTGAATYETVRRAKDGTLVYIDSSSKVIQHQAGAVQYILWSKKDVTQLKVTRDAKLVEARFGGLLESMPDAIIMANASGRVVLANRQAETLFGYGRGELRGTLLEQLMPARFRGSHVGHRSDYFTQPQVRPMGSGRDLYGLRKDGKEFPVEISLSPIETGEGMLIMSAIRDSSERRHIEHTLHEKNIELANANAAKDRFLAGMSHELRTPLNAIIGFTGTMLMKLPGPINSEQERQLHTIQGSARHLLSLINDLLDLTKIESGKVELNFLPLQGRPLIEEVLQLFRQPALQKELALSFDSEPHDVALMTDRRALQQILMNLINNAIKFTVQGEVAVRLDVVTRDGAACARVSVRDTGPGIAPEQQGRLFQAFAQLDASNTRPQEGTGLGLHLSQKLAGLLHGHIEFESQYGVGSTFTLVLPLD
ncbi:PAS domain-containing sensor histidine kinase [Rugamonas apoptosis]|uniref:Virulence sensor protein BvgS n=1 Tax=Rugamonas apoptosis TaxID=2758570 RepID=A0A7W2IJZ0_9BURK|nr:PAS domain S-box protein [Rugamonas apoptosis]MBA5686776.1 PAS domain S-box protein [Rugamonas apoptosis]